ncbi:MULTISPECIES: hemolysin XhlA family protein [Bacillus]|uniref:hemolysin XhlA family protein n=1 Tax=Bacillus TaxID=1386 RepID=UPI000626E5A3|nr:MULTISPECIES: hemolysin XhlA family protein [Bacillus]KKK10333.1 protein xhlA [Bacillus sp. L_1B0_12]MCL7873798.1 hemolysin XhlA family protein [Bacillus altitudinis]
MSEVTEVNSMNIIQKDISELKNSHTTLEQRVNILERGQDKHDQQIISLNNQLNKIEENTTWIKRTITGAIITAVCTGVIGGGIALVYTMLQK